MTPESTLLSRRYADVLRANGCSERTINNYLYSRLCRFLGERSLRQASAEDIVAYQVEVSARGLSDSAVRVATYALRGFFQKVLERSDWNLRAACQRAGIEKRVTSRSLRHAFATHLVESGTRLQDVKSPLDELSVGSIRWLHIRRLSSHR